MNPAPRKIKLTAPGGIAVTWSDGHESTYGYAYLRKKCPCATCRDNPPRVISDDDPFRLVGTEPIKPVGADPVGHYAISFRWNDGHSSGIYAFDYLRELCPCEACSAKS